MTVYDMIVTYARGHGGNTPTYREIASALDTSPTTALGRVRELIKQGKLVLKDRKIFAKGSKYVPPADWREC